MRRIALLIVGIVVFFASLASAQEVRLTSPRTVEMIKNETPVPVPSPIDQVVTVHLTNPPSNKDNRFVFVAIYRVNERWGTWDWVNSSTNCWNPNFPQQGCFDSNGVAKFTEDYWGRALPKAKYKAVTDGFEYYVGRSLPFDVPGNGGWITLKTRELRFDYETAKMLDLRTSARVIFDVLKDSNDAVETVSKLILRAGTETEGWDELETRTFTGSIGQYRTRFDETFSIESVERGTSYCVDLEVRNSKTKRLINRLTGCNTKPF